VVEPSAFGQSDEAAEADRGGSTASDDLLNSARIPRWIRRAAPTSSMTVKAAAEVASTAESPTAAAKTWTVTPSAVPMPG
jgi:hypothetical protein